MKKNKKINLLDLTPFRKHEHRIDTDGNVEILIPRFRNRKIQKILLLNKKKSPFFVLHLDKIGSETWLLMDGYKKIQNICDDLSEKFGEEVKPVEERVCQFITTLYQNGYIAFKELQKGGKESS
jgi:hypothetical protein